ncbi:beta-ketoacyl-ACP synthase II, partial [Mycobacterium tuberculosis]
QGDVGKIDYLNPHGTGTPIGDLKEMDAVRTVFGQAVPLISSTKSLTGHSLGAAGAQEAIYCLLMMQGDFAAKSAHIDHLDEAFADLPILLERKDHAGLETVMSNSFGFGGTNGALVLRRI